MANYEKVVEMFGERLASWLSLLSKWIKWGVDFKKFLDSLHQVKKEELLGFVDGSYKLVKQKTMEFLSYVCCIKIGPVEKFTVGDFYKTGREDLPMFFEYDFNNWIISPMKKMKLFSKVKTFLHKFLLKKDAHDTEIQSDFVGNPVIPVKKFVILLKSMLEAQPKGAYKEDGLDNSGKSNIFNVDLTEINSELGVVAVYVVRYGDAWKLYANTLDCFRRWGIGNHFFSLAPS